MSLRKRCLGKPSIAAWCFKCVRWTGNPNGKLLLNPPARHGLNGWTCKKRVAFVEEALKC
jgi:hypothetical protein